MTREEMRERVMMALLLHKAADDAVDAVIAIIRGETLEEAARVAEDCAPVSQDTFSMELAERCDMVAAAIRALKDKP